MTAPILAHGNTAKLYCLNLIQRFAESRGGELRVIDLGCGDAAIFLSLLRMYPSIRYVGVEPDRQRSAQAQSNLRGFNAEVHAKPAYHLQLDPADVVVSFSTLEHVYRRLDYLRAAQRNLRVDGLCLINYDSGHFVMPGGRLWQRGSDRWKNRFGPLLARLGAEGSFQAPVLEGEFQSLVSEVGLRIVDEKLFNTDLKRAYGLLPEDRRAEFMSAWYEFELYLNRLGIEYRDEYASVFRTRNFLLVFPGAEESVRGLVQ